MMTANQNPDAASEDARRGMTATQIAADNQANRHPAVPEAVAGGPFDDSDLDAPPDVDGSLADAATAPPTPVQAELRRRLDEARNPGTTPPPAPTPGRFDLDDHPRIADGVVIPARSVAEYLTAVHSGAAPPGSMALYGWRLGQRVPAHPEYVRVSSLGPIHVAVRAIGSYLPSGGQWLPLWVGVDPDARQGALDALLGALADWETRIRR